MIMKMEKCWDFMHYCVFMHWRIPIFLHDSTNAYTTRQENVHYVYHNAIVTVVIPNGCLTSITLKNARPTRKGAQEVYKLFRGSILARVGRV